MGLRAGLIVVALALMPAQGVTHPHVFVAGGADFVLDPEGRLASVRITWIYDTFSSLYLVQYVGADADGDGVLSEEDEAKVLADQLNWPDDFEGDSYLFYAGDPVPLGRAENGSTRLLEDGRIEVIFDRAVSKPFRPEPDGPHARLKQYDPVYYYAYETSADPKIIAAEDHGCTAELIPFQTADKALRALQVELSALGRDETPTQQGVGALFSDELVLACD